MSMNISSISNAMYCIGVDPEYQRIVRELRVLGLEPTGDKQTDKMRLEAAKLAKMAENNEMAKLPPVESSNETSKNQAFSSQDEAKNSLNTGAINTLDAEHISNFNKLKLLGLY